MCKWMDRKVRFCQNLWLSSINRKRSGSQTPNSFLYTSPLKLVAFLDPQWAYFLSLGFTLNQVVEENVDIENEIIKFCWRWTLHFNIQRCWVTTHTHRVNRRLLIYSKPSAPQSSPFKALLSFFLPSFFFSLSFRRLFDSHYGVKDWWTELSWAINKPVSMNHH